ncbi:MAG: CvpA family protein [Alicyclobacillus sp.]|nr:CvpA family protein [Alicyclobacillus sp.]
MNVLDLVMIAVVALGAWNGYRSGLFRQVTRLFGAVLAYFAGLWLRPYLAPVVAAWLPQAKPAAVGAPATVMPWLLGDLANALSFLAVFALSFFVLRYCASLLDTLFSLPGLSLLNRAAGLCVGAALAVVLVYVGTLAAHYVQNPRVQNALSQSLLVQWLDERPVGLPQQPSGQPLQESP